MGGKYEITGWSYPYKEKMNEYDCKICVNQGSPLCKICNFVIKTNQEKTKPDYFIKRSEIILPKRIYNTRQEALRQTLIYYLRNKAPIPEVIVQEYNQLVEEKGK